MQFRNRFRLLPLLLFLGVALPASIPSHATPEPGEDPGASAPPRREKPAEVRGVWVVRTDLTTPQAVSRVIRYAKADGLNTLFIQCRGRGDAYYQSELEPRAQALAKQPASFDPLAQAVEEGHAAGLQVHAWVNTCYVWSDKSAPWSAEHIVRAHPDWLAVDIHGRRRRVGDDQVFICPGNPAARAHLVAVCRDIAKRYDVDGIQLDYIRYADRSLCYCDGCLQRFEESRIGKTRPERIRALKAGGRLGLVRAFPSTWAQFRRDQITSLVREIRTAVKAEKSGLTLSAAVIPWGPYPGDFARTEAYNIVAQDWFGWMRSGLVDAVCPMTYQTNLRSFTSWVSGVRRNDPSFPAWFGIGAWLFGPDSAAAKVRAVRAAGGRGWVLFSYTAVTNHGTDDGYLRALKARVLSHETASTPRAGAREP